MIKKNEVYIFLTYLNKNNFNFSKFRRNGNIYFSVYLLTKITFMKIDIKTV